MESKKTEGREKGMKEGERGERRGGVRGKDGMMKMGRGKKREDVEGR